MSTNVGTLQPKVRIGLPIWAIAFALLAVVSTVVLVTSADRGADRDAPTTVSGTSANTPSELRGGLIQAPAANTAANTPSELRGGLIQAPAATQVSGVAVSVRAKQLGLDVVAPAIAPAPVTEIMARNAMLASYQQARSIEIIAARNAMLASYQQAPSDDIVVNGEVCQICWKYR
jgi:hypothetical protein